MRAGLQMLCAVVFLGAESAFGQDVDLQTQFSVKRYTVPTDQQIAQARAEFLALREPLEYQWVVDEPPKGPWSGDHGTSRVVLQGDMQELAASHGLAVLVYALWPYLRDPEYEARAFLVLESMVDAIDNGLPLGYSSRAEPGDWPMWKKSFLTGYGWYCAKALGEHGKDWYPHKVPFDPATVLADRKDPVKRVAHVEALRAALRDPALRVENPLGVKDVIGLLSKLDAREAAPEVASYLFFSWKQGANFQANMDSLRIREVSAIPNAVLSDQNGLGCQCPAPYFLADTVGESSVSLALDRYSNTTPVEQSVGEGGGCAPLFLLYYFVGLDYTRAQAVVAIDAYLQSRPGLTPEQTDAINGLRTIIQSGQYQTDRSFFDLAPGWDTIPAP